MESVFQVMARLEQEGSQFVVCTVIEATGSTPGRTSFRMLVQSDGTQTGTVGGGKLELLATEAAREVLRTGSSRVVTYDLEQEGANSIGMLCGGQVTLFIEYVGFRPPVYVFGGGHIGMQVARFAATVGFDVTVIDDRPEVASPARIPEAHHFMTGDFVEIIVRAPFRPQGYHVILTDKHSSDERVLRSLLERGVDARYIGMIGSRAKILEVYHRLAAAGIAVAELARVHAPIGVDHGGQTAEEIALSIAVELVAVRHDRQMADSLRDKAHLAALLEQRP